MGRRRHSVWLATGVVALATATLTTAALALWAAQGATADLAPARAMAGFAVTKDDVSDIATGSADTVQFTIGEAEATTLVDDGPDGNGTFAVAVPFDVTLLASAGYGMDYSIDIATPQSGTVFGLPGTTAVFFPVDDTAPCTVAEAATAQTYPAPVSVSGLAATGNAPGTQTDAWCLVESVTPPTYTTTASGDGTNLLGDPESSTSGNSGVWSAYVMPDPALEPNLAVTLTPVPVPA
ncbi:MAG: hypothetical protein FWC46_09570 [Actinomycetia bacterium]|nr:hypothetical protein [Actinomycetes bacterium]